METRGGARHKPKPRVDEDVLHRIFEVHKNHWVDCGVYESISKSQACHGEGLASRHDMIADLLEVSPAGNFATGPARQAMARIVTQNPGINTTIYNGSVFIGARLDRISTMLFHVRRLASEPHRLTQLAMKCGGASMVKIKGLIKLVSLEEYEPTIFYDPQNPEKHIRKPPVLDDQGFPMILKRSKASSSLGELAEEPPPRRSLKRNVSEVSNVSMDSMGFPKMLQDSSPVQLRRLGSKTPDPKGQLISQEPSEAAQSEVSRAARLKMALGITPTPKSSCKAKSKAVKQQAPATSKAAKAEPEEYAIYQVYLDCFKVTKGTSQSQSQTVIIFKS